MRVLIAEDDLTSRAMLAAVLGRWGLEPLAVEDGDAAWSLLQSPDAPRLVLLDWSMPGMDGVEVCRRVRQTGSTDPPYIIMLTARGEMSDLVQGLDAGANDYVRKPFDSEELRARVRVGVRVLEQQAELSAARDALAHQAMHDALTGVLNGRAVLDMLQRAVSWAKREEGRLSVGMCDIDHFKVVNDTYGHQVGDEVLIGLTKRAQSHLREHDLLGRCGGEEFLVITSTAKGQEEGSPFERLRAAIAETPIETRAGGVPVTVSIGVAVSAGDTTVDQILAAADRALYEAKAQGRNRVVYA